LLLFSKQSIKAVETLHIVGQRFAILDYGNDFEHRLRLQSARGS